MQSSLSAFRASGQLTRIPLTVDLLFESSPDCAKQLDIDGRLVSMNENGQCLMEVDDFSKICGQPWPLLWPPEARVQIEDALNKARQGQAAQFVAFCPTAKGTPKWWDVRVTPIYDRAGQLQGFLSVSRDITALQTLLQERMKAEILAEGQKAALEQAVSGAPLADVLRTLVTTAESYADSDLRGSVLLLDEETQELKVGAAPSLPSGYNDAVNGLKIGPQAGTCGTAAFRKEAVLVGSIATDPLWAGQTELPLSHGLRSCWSYPILCSEGRVLGTFAFYYSDEREPNALEKEAMPLLVHTASLVLQRHRETHERVIAETALREARTRLKATLAAGEVATWIFDIQSGQVHGDSNFAKLFQLEDVSEGNANEICWDAVHHDDVQTVRALMHHAIATGDPYEALYRVRDEHGQYHHVIARGKVQYDDAGKPALLPGVVLDITRQRQAEEELRVLASRLAEANRRKTEFLATLAHELRNPLAPIRNGLEVLRLAPSNPSAASKVQDMMLRQVDNMVHLIDDLLDMARIDSGKIELKKEQVELAAVAASAVEASLPLIDAAHHTLEVNIPNEQLLLEADAMRLSQVLTNLLGNAAKYTPPHGMIRLNAHRENGEVVVAVSDNGIGIPEAELGTIFDLFSQVGRSLGRSQGGLGIGLSLVARLVQLHGGSVVATSRGEGKGSTFTVRLPLVDSEKRIVPPDLASPTRAGGADSPSLRIVVADDNADVTESMATLLRMAGHDVATANDGNEAIVLVHERQPDLVFLDIGMPGLSGYEVARRIRASGDLDETMLVAVTGWGAEQDRALARDAGFDEHLTKPATMRSIAEVLSKRVQLSVG